MNGACVPALQPYQVARFSRLIHENQKANAQPHYLQTQFSMLPLCSVVSVYFLILLF